jgi:hypothetical protein
VWGFTPFQLTGQHAISLKNQQRDDARALQIAAMGARGESKEITKLLQDWSK